MNTCLKLKWIKLPAMLLAACMLAAPALADEPAGTEALASLSAQASSEVPHDTVEITLAAELAGQDQKKLVEELNKRLDSTMKKAKGHENIEVRSGQYRVWPMSDQDGRISEWRARGEIILRSMDFPAVSALAAELGEQMPPSDLNFSLSEQRRADEEAALLQDAVRSFQNRAGALAKALGYDDYRLKSIELGGSGIAPRMQAARSMMMAADVASVPLEAGMERVMVNLQGSIVLLTTDKAKGQPGS